MLESVSIPQEGMVACEVCLTEIPVFEVISSEALDYVRHVCGTECYGRWQKQADVSTAEPGANRQSVTA